MKWFKHSCTARDDQKISKLMDELGLEGYGAYMIILEVVGHEMGSTSECFAEFSLKKWGSFAQLSAKKFAKFAEVMAKLSLFDAQILEKNCRIEIPNLLKYRDNHSRNLQVADKKVSLDKEKEKEKEKDIRKVVPTCKKKKASDYSKAFEDFWTLTRYPKLKQDTKGDMAKKFEECLKSGLTSEEILFASDAYAELNRGDKYTIGLRRFLTPLTVKQYLTEDVASTSKTAGKRDYSQVKDDFTVDDFLASSVEPERFEAIPDKF